MLVPQDTVIYNFLSQITEFLPHDELDLIDVQIQDRQVVVNCKNSYLAFQCWKWVYNHCSSEKPLSLEVVVLLNGTAFDTSSRLETMTLSSWVQQNKALFESFKQMSTTSIHAETDGYQYLAVQPYLGLEAVLNKPVRELLMQPADVVSSEIAEARIDCIRRAIASGGSATNQYTHFWQGADWKKETTAVYLAGHEQVLVFTRPARGEEWQQGFWSNWRERVISA